MGRRAAVRIVLFAALFTAAGVVLAACNLLPASGDPRDPDVFDKVRQIDLLPRFPKQQPASLPPGGTRVKSTIYAGDDQPPIETQPLAKPTSSGDGYELNFENTPVASVAKVVLGDILGVGYVIDPRVQSLISLSSGRPVPKSDILFVLENALRLSGVALVRDAAAYRLMPAADAVGAGQTELGTAEAGYGVSVVPLQFVSSQTILKLIDSFATRPGMVRADAARNLVLIQGTGAERRNAVDLVLSFDQDWMRGQSVGIFPVTNSNPEPIIAELEKILDSGENGIGHNVVKLQAIGRMNAVMAVTRKPELLQRVEKWVRRLDMADTGRSGVHVYQLKFGDARQIARVLSDIFGSGPGGSGSSLDSGIAPGSGMSASSSSALNRLSHTTTSSQSGGGLGGGGLGSARPGSGGLSSTGSGLGGGIGGGSSAASNAASAAAASQAPSLFDSRAGGAFGSTAGGTGGPGGPGGVMAGVRITADSVNNTLLIYANQEQYTTIERTIRQIDRPQLQVAIDATVAEVTLNDNLSYGVQFYLQSRNLGLPAERGSLLNTTATEVTNALINRAFPGFNFLIGKENTPNVILDALHNVTDVKVLSNPSLVVIDNQTATLQVGDEIPVSTGSANVLTTSNTVVNTIDYRSTGIILHVVPRINANGNVRLEIEQEISNVVPNATAETLTPTVAQRKVRSSVAVASGQTVLLAGLISDRQQGGRSGIPLLDQIPVLGEAASHANRGTTRTELIIFIRPQIIRDGVDAHFVAEELRTKLRGTLGATAPGPRYR